MKIKPEHLEHIRQAIKPFNNDFHRSRYKAAGHSDKRYRWDLAYYSGLTQFICETLYTYLNDDHIDTALRKLIAPL